MSILINSRQLKKKFNVTVRIQKKIIQDEISGK